MWSFASLNPKMPGMTAGCTDASFENFRKKKKRPNGTSGCFERDLRERERLLLSLLNRRGFFLFRTGAIRWRQSTVSAREPGSPGPP